MGSLQGRSQDLTGGGGKNYFFGFGNLHVTKRHMLSMAKPCALFGGFRDMPPPMGARRGEGEKAYIGDRPLENPPNTIFILKINSSDTCLLWDNSHEEICVLVCFLKEL